MTNTHSTTIYGDVGVSPGTEVTGFPPGTVTGGTIHLNDENAGLAQDAVTTAYNDLAAEPCTVDLTGQDLGGMTLTHGVYCFSSSAQLTGQLTLNAEGSADAVFIFQIGSTLTTASSSSVLVTNGGVDCNVFWQVGSSATIGTGTVFVGNILALASITLTTGVDVSGRALASTGAVTMDTNDVGFLTCAAPHPTYTPTATATPLPPTPTATATLTPIPPTPTYTLTPVVHRHTRTPSPAPAGPTSTPEATPQPPRAPVNAPSPTPPAGPRFPPNTGDPPPQGGLPWIPLLLGLVLSSLAATGFALSRRGQRPGV